MLIKVFKVVFLLSSHDWTSSSSLSQPTSLLGNSNMASNVNNVMFVEEENHSAPAQKLQKNVLDLFWKLAKADTSIRLNACSSMISALAQKQKQFQASDDESRMCPELEYALDRFVRGLASTREAARQGYCLALSEVVRVFPAVGVGNVIQLVEKNLPINVKQDKCHMVIGQAMAYNALALSSRLASSPHLPSTVVSFFHLSSNRAFLQHASYLFLEKVLSELNEETFKDSLWPHLKSELKCGWDKATPQVLAWLLLCLRTFPDAISQKFLEKHWDGSDFLDDKNLSHWRALIRQSTMTHPRVHPVCLEFLELILQKKLFKDLWIHVIDENLFEMDQNEKAFLGFQLVKEMLGRVKKKKKMVKYVISSNFTAMFSRSYMQTKSPLHSAAAELASFLCDYVKENEVPEIQISVLMPFLHQTGRTYLQKIMNRKEVVLIISYLHPDAVKYFFSHLKNIVVQDNNSDEGGHKQHQAVVQIGALVTHPQMLSDTEWRISVVKFLFLHSYFSVKKPCQNIPEADKVTESFPSSLRQTFAHCFTKALDALTRKAGDSAVNVLQTIADFAEELLNAREFVEPLFQFEKIEHAWCRLRKLLKKLRKHVGREGAKTHECRAFQVLLLHLGLLLFQDEPKPLLKTLEELNTCCKNCLKIPSSADESLSAAEDADDGPPWIQVLVDILLSLLSQSSNHMRLIIRSVFPLFCPFITEPALQLIFDVVSPSRSNEPTLEEEDDEDDVEFVSGSSSSEDDDEENDKAKGGNESSDSEKEFKEKLQKVFGSSADDSDAEDSDVVVSDSDMFKLDNAISKAFRSRGKSGSSQRKSEQKVLIDFRLRCLDLITLYLKSDPPLSMALKCIKPLLSSCHEEVPSEKKLDINSRVMSVLKQITKMKKNVKGLEVSEVEDLFKFLFEQIHKGIQSEASPVISSLCVFLLCCERKLKLKNSEDFDPSELLCLQAYITGLDDFVKRGSTQMQPHTFLSLFTSCPEYAWQFVKPLEKYAYDGSIRLFRRAQCLGLIVAALKVSRPQTHITVDMWTARTGKIVKKTIEALKTVFSNEDIKPTYTTELMDVLMTVYTILQEKEAESVVQHFPGLLDVLTSISEEQCKKLAKKGSHSRNRLIHLLGGKISKFGIRKGEDQVVSGNAKRRKAKRLKVAEDQDVSRDVKSKNVKRLKADVAENQEDNVTVQSTHLNGDVNMFDSDSGSEDDS